MKRTLTAFLTALVLLSAIPALAAGGPDESSAVKVLGSNGTVTVGIRHTWTDWATWEGNRQDTMVYTTDGVHWRDGEPGPMVRTYESEGGTESVIDAFRGCWDGERFLVWSGTTGEPSYCSADGVHWAERSGPAPRSCPRGAAELGPYRFELEGNDLWLLDRSGKGLVLPAVKEACPYMTLGDVQAYYGPDDSVIVEVYDQWDTRGSGKKVFPYAVSSLDWCLENLARPRMPKADNVYQQTVYTAGGGVILCRAQVGTLGTEYWTSTDGTNWIPILDGGWNGDQYGTRLHGFNGKSFVIQDLYSGFLYASENGADWKKVESPILELDSPGDAEYEFAWTGDGYLARASLASAGQRPHGPAVRHFGPHLNEVLFLDADFQPTGAGHDFGLRVSGVSVANGVCYAEVAESVTGDQWGELEENTAVYASADRAEWRNGGLYELPRQLPQGARVAESGLNLADPYFLELDAGGTLWVSLDGVNYGSLGPFPDAEHMQGAGGVQGYAGQDGLLVRGVYATSWSPSGYNWSVYRLPTEVAYNDTLKTYTRAELDGALAHAAALEEREVKTVAGGGVQVRQVLLELQGEWGVIRSRRLWEWSCDEGATWTPVDFGGSDAYGELELLPYNGRSFLLADQFNGVYLVSEDGAHWRNLPMEWRGGSYGTGCFLWTGDGYLVRQETYDHGMMFIPAEFSEECHQLLFLDENFNVNGRHDFGAQVTDMAFQNGVYYAQVEGGTVYTSRDRETWAASASPMP